MITNTSERWKTQNQHEFGNLWKLGILCSLLPENFDGVSSVLKDVALSTSHV